jgi:hypothetical protein
VSEGFSQRKRAASESGFVSTSSRCAWRIAEEQSAGRKP